MVLSARPDSAAIRFAQTRMLLERRCAAFTSTGLASEDLLGAPPL